MALEIFDERLKRRMPGIFPAQSLASMQPEVMSETVVEQEPMPELVDVGAYLDDQAAIQQNRDKWSSRIRAMGGNISFPSLGDDTMRRAGIQKDMYEAEVLNRQRAAILRGDISNIDEQMAWYQRSGFDPHFAKTAREAAQSIFDQRFQETGAETAKKVEERAVRGAELREEEALRAAERFKFAESEDRRKREKHSSEKTDKSRNELKTARENLLLRWAAKKWWDLEPEERTEAKREEIAREMILIAENPNFQGFEVIAGRTVPKTGRDQYTVAPSPIDLDEKSLIDTFRNEAKVVLKDEEKEDEDFVSAPARTYSDQYEEDWRTAADDFETASDLAGTINAAIRADESIAPENKQAVLEQVLKNLESVEKGVGRPTEPSPQAAVVREKRLEDRLFERTENVKADMANSTRVFNELMDRYSQNNPYLAQMTLGLREAQVFDRMISIMSYGPNPLSMPMVEEFRNNVANVGDDSAAKETHLRWFAETNRIPMRMAEYILNPEEYKKRQF